PSDRLHETATWLLHQEGHRPFDLRHGPLLRVLLLRLGEEFHQLIMTVHHIASDGWSAEIIDRELAEAYAAALTTRTPQLPELPIQYVDFAVWQREWLRGEVLENQLAYW